jgi:SAM-dependent methyltransferase
VKIGAQGLAALAARPYDRAAMARDLYARPPRPADSGALTRRALFRLSPAPGGGPPDLASRRAAITAAWSRPGAAAFRRAIEPVAGVLAELSGAVTRDRVLEVPDTADLEHETGPFAVVTSAFGVAQDPDPDGALARIVRVVQPGGALAMAAWVPRGLPGRLTEFAEQIVPLPAGVPSPSEWGRAEVATRRLSRVLSDLQIRTRTIRLSFPDPDAAFTSISAPLPFPDSRLDELRPAFDRLLASCNDAIDGVEIAGRYLVAVGRTAR